MIRSEYGFILSWTHTRGEQYNFKGGGGRGFQWELCNNKQNPSNFSSWPKNTADISGSHHWSPSKMTSGERARKFHTDDVSLPGSGQWIWLAEARFPRGTANRKHCSDPGSEASSVWNFCSHSKEVISRETSGDVGKFGCFLRYFSPMNSDQHALKKWQKKIGNSNKKKNNEPFVANSCWGQI